MAKLDRVKLEIALADMMFARETAREAIERLNAAVRDTTETFAELDVQARIMMAQHPFLEDGTPDHDAMKDFAALDKAAESLACLVREHTKKP
ncbi:hypothetical protein [Mesorhizobium sp.]|uniref:hypothetical protein n=1 Tax=Mesorhizobium sp. TaxID=1871066 RepID=UPI000FE641D8|nr:hypothetical protein [Mesorhizobium sp.]RWC25933.1 MAG: hypothetical protein EOS27_27160 [Mesorhizobium sp.]TIX27283.1 MAG: hypothetical protein E5V35_06950 [Mesorhizobium sp.]